jgi:hypothetical protein
MKVAWTCEMAIGPASWYWSGDWVYGPGECPGDGEFEIDLKEWDEMTFDMTCTSCGQEMDPFCDHFTADTGETSSDLYNRVMS